MLGYPTKPTNNSISTRVSLAGVCEGRNIADQIGQDARRLGRRFETLQQSVMGDEQDLIPRVMTRGIHGFRMATA